eukprot:6180861-Pleurochrysis_carterae.AAC.1
MAHTAFEASTASGVAHSGPVAPAMSNLALICIVSRQAMESLPSCGLNAATPPSLRVPTGDTRSTQLTLRSARRTVSGAATPMRADAAAAVVPAAPDSLQLAQHNQT